MKLIIKASLLIFLIVSGAWLFFNFNSSSNPHSHFVNSSSNPHGHFANSSSANECNDYSLIIDEITGVSKGFGSTYSVALLDAKDGSEKWVGNKTIFSESSHPLLYDGKSLFGLSSDPLLVVSYDKSTGGINWQFPLSGISGYNNYWKIADFKIEGNKLIIVVDDLKNLKKLSISLSKNGSFLGNKEEDYNPYSQSNQVISENDISYSTGDADNILIAKSSKGNKIWEVELGGGSRTGALLSLENDGDSLFAVTTMGVFRIKKEDGNIVEKYVLNDSDGVLNAFEGPKDVLVFSFNSKLVDFDRGTEEEKWSEFIPDKVMIAPGTEDYASLSFAKATEDKIFLTSNNGFLYCLDAGNGEVVWKKKVGFDSMHAGVKKFVLTKEC